MELLFPLLIVFMIGMIFVSNRQRRKQQTKQESLQGSLAVGDIVVMTSGISGTIVDTDDERTIDLEIAPDVVTTWLRAAVREKLGGEAGESAPVEESTPLEEAAPLGEAGSAPTAGARPASSASPATPVASEAPALETSASASHHEGTAEGTPSVRADEPTDAPSTAGGSRP